MDLNTLYHRTVESWADRVNAVGDDQWDRPTPCREWTVRDLANHVAGEDLWTAPLVQGSTIEEVGDRFDGDLLGENPIGAVLMAAAEATRAVALALPAHGTVHLSYGDETLDEYVHQLAADHLVHGWDLAVATGSDPRLDPALVAEVSAWFADREELYRQAGIVGARVDVSGDAQTEMLAAFGRDPAWGPNHAGLVRLSAAVASGDVDAIMALMADECVCEASGPAPDGGRHTGAAAVRAVWDERLGRTGARFSEEEAFVCGERGALRWRLDWTDDDGNPGRVRGVDVLRMHAGLVTELYSYVKS